jgi:phage shock protein C
MAMYCKQCGNSIAENARFCSVCGTEVSPAAAYPRAATRQLIRPRAGRMIAGVCQGIANQYAWDVAWVRVIAVLAALFGGGLGAVAYVVLWVVTPEEPLSLPPGRSYTPSS